MILRSLGFLGFAIVGIIVVTFLLHHAELNKSSISSSEVPLKSTFVDVGRSVSPPAPADILRVVKPEVATNVTGKRLLFMTASYTFDQFHSLQKVLDCMRDICNAGWEVSVLIDSASGFNYSHPRYAEIQHRMFCVRTGAPIPIVIEEYGKIGFGLNAKHRQYMAAHLNEFDYFSYAEEDMLLTVSHLSAYIKEQDKLKIHLGSDWIRYFIGFIR